MNATEHTAPRPVTLSVCIASIGRDTLLSRAVPSVLAAGPDADIEVVIALGPEAPPVASIDDDRVVCVVGARPAGAARNRAVAAASGEFVMFLDDDDALAPGWWPTVAALVAAPDTSIVTGGFAWFEDGDEVGREDREDRPLSALHGAHAGTFLAGTYAVRRSIFDAVSGYDERFASSENWELAIRLLRELDRRGGRLVRTETVLLHRYPNRRPDEYPSRPIAELMLDKYAADLARLPALRSQYHAQVGVGFAREGDLRAARGAFVRSVRSNATDPRAWLRLVTSWVGPAARRRWPVVLRD